MASRMHRRDFLRVTVVSATALGGALPACSSDGDDPSTPSGPPPDPPAATSAQRTAYPQGVASGDPTPSSVILWTRVDPGDDDPAVEWEVAKDLEFKNIVARAESDDDKPAASSSEDHTVKLKVTGLEPGTYYYYRFTARGVTSMIGRTKTAPSEDGDVPVRFAFASCQDFVGRRYHSWQALLDEDIVDFVVYLGDYIYETNGDESFQTPGEGRSITIPDGIVLDPNTGSKAAESLEDYRGLYKQFRSDTVLQRAHQLFPFVVIWDDHEFANDCWSDHSTHFSDTRGTEQVPAQRKAADRAWFEYQPADITYEDDKDYPDDIKIYRKLKFGKHMDLFLTDQRYYRDDHVIPEGPTNLEVAKIVADSAIGSRIFVLKKGFDPLEAAKKPTMLGATQKEWLNDVLWQSTATWKVWGNEVQLSQMLAQLARFETLPDFARDTFYLTTDQWDGYRSERADILGDLEGISNLVAITGDIHAFYASELHVDFDNPGEKPVGVEFVVAGISSQAIAPAAQSVLDDPTFAGLGLGALIPDFDDILLEGSPWYRYANSFHNGIAVVDVTEERFDVEFLVVKGEDVVKDGKPSIERVRLHTVSGTNKIVVG